MSKPSVLFVCVHNAGRSQMAAAFLTHLSEGAVEVRSAGSAPADQVNPAAVQAMAEVGIDITAETAQDPDRPGGPRVRRGDHHGLRRHLPVLPRQTLRGLGARRPGRPGRRSGPPDPRRDPARGSRCSSANSSPHERRRNHNVLANPPAKVSTVNASTRRAPDHRVSAANAGGYSTALIATPATSHATTNHRRVGASATPTTATRADAPSRASSTTAARAGPATADRDPQPAPDTTRPAENAAVSAGGDQPVSAADPPRQHRERVVQDAPAGDLGDAQRHQHPPSPARVVPAVRRRPSPASTGGSLVSVTPVGSRSSPAAAPTVSSDARRRSAAATRRRAGPGRRTARHPPHTPVSGSVSSTRAAASWSPASSAATLRTCS